MSATNEYYESRVQRTSVTSVTSIRCNEYYESRVQRTSVTSVTSIRCNEYYESSVTNECNGFKFNFTEFVFV
jgi:hypothetical protein